VQGNQGTSTITTTVSGGFNSSISLSASGAPSGTTVSFNPSTIAAPGGSNSTMTITVGASTATGTYPITVTGNGGGIQQNVTITLVVATIGQGKTYSTNFPSRENPISESGNWYSLAANTGNWSPVQTFGGHATGIMDSNNGGNYNDSTAVLTGSWASNQSVQATVYAVNSGSTPEVELRLNTSLSPTNCSGYEIDFAVPPQGPYVYIVRWNGPLGSFVEAGGGSTCNYPAICGGVLGTPALHNGDVVKAVNINGTISAYINGVLVAQAVDTTFRNGSPGIGMAGPIGTNSTWGFSSFTATDNVSSNVILNGVTVSGAKTP
jgi:hypothetical protein